jgi:hypothetical protein
MRPAVLCIASSGLGAALLLAPPAPAVRDAVRRAASFCRLEAALLLAPLAPAMRLAVLGIAYSGLGAALVLASLAPAMRLAVFCIALSGLGAFHCLTPLASAMRRAVSTGSSQLGAALQLTLPPAHGSPPASLPRRNPNAAAARHHTAVTHPLSALNGSLVHTGHHTHDGGSARAGQTLQHVSAKMVKSAWAGDVRWVCSRERWTGTPP